MSPSISVLGGVAPVAPTPTVCRHIAVNERTWWYCGARAPTPIVGRGRMSPSMSVICPSMSIIGGIWQGRPQRRPSAGAAMSPSMNVIGPSRNVIGDSAATPTVGRGRMSLYERNCWYLRSAGRDADCRPGPHVAFHEYNHHLGFLKPPPRATYWALIFFSTGGLWALDLITGEVGHVMIPMLGVWLWYASGMVVRRLSSSSSSSSSSHCLAGRYHFST